MKELEKEIEKIEEFDRSIRHLPQEERKKLWNEMLMESKESARVSRKLMIIGLTFLLPALIFYAFCCYQDSVYTNVRQILLTMTLSPLMILVSEKIIKKKKEHKNEK